MGTSSFVRADYNATYLLLSKRWDLWRFTIRGDVFDVKDFDESNSIDQKGSALTLSLSKQINSGVITAEYVSPTSERVGFENSPTDDPFDDQFLINYRIDF